MRRTKAEAEETRRGILSAAERLFEAKGLAATSLEEIAAEAGVTRGAVYWHFTNKADLVIALLADAPLFHEDMLALLAEDDPAGPLGALEAMVIAQRWSVSPPTNGASASVPSSRSATSASC